MAENLEDLKDALALRQRIDSCIEQLPSGGWGNDPVLNALIRYAIRATDVIYQHEDALRAGLADSALDWCDKNPHALVYSSAYHGRMGGWTVVATNEEYPTLRAAIDAARGVHPGGATRETAGAEAGEPRSDSASAEPLEFYARCLDGCARVLALRHAGVDHGENYCTCGYLRARAVHSEQARQELPPSGVHTPAPTEPLNVDQALAIYEYAYLTAFGQESKTTAMPHHYSAHRTALAKVIEATGPSETVTTLPNCGKIPMAEHRCGVRGFDGMKGDRCPACQPEPFGGVELAALVGHGLYRREQGDERPVLTWETYERLLATARRNTTGPRAMSGRWTEDLEFLREVAGRSKDSDLALPALSRLSDHLADYGTLRASATAVVAYWDSLDAVQEDDERPTELFKTEMDGRINALRTIVEGSPTSAHHVDGSE